MMSTWWHCMLRVLLCFGDRTRILPAAHLLGMHHLLHLTEYGAKWPDKRFNFSERSPVPEPLSSSQTFTHNCTSIEYLEHLWTVLTAVKQQLSDKVLSDWSRHTSVTDASAWIKQEIESQVIPGPELLTRAWIKCHEILSSFPLIDCCTEQPLRALLLCEAPGAFVSAINHFIHNRSQAKRVREFQWTATSLNPYHEASANNCNAITDDSLIRDTRDHWFFGDDGTGDILSPSFTASLRRLADRDGLFDLVTGDGGISVVNDFEYQERSALPLVVAQCVNALYVLKRGGNFVLKVFSLLEPQSVCLVYIMHQAFQKVSVFKPVSSKSGNNELYLVCTNFSPAPFVGFVIESLTARLQSNCDLSQLLCHFSILPVQQIPLPFLIEFEAAVTQFCHWQKEAIETNVRLYGAMSSSCRKELTSAKKRRARVFLKKFPLSPIAQSDRLCVRNKCLF